MAQAGDAALPNEKLPGGSAFCAEIDPDPSPPAKVGHTFQANGARCFLVGAPPWKTGDMVCPTLASGARIAASTPIFAGNEAHGPAEKRIRD